MKKITYKVLLPLSILLCQTSFAQTTVTTTTVQTQTSNGASKSVETSVDNEVEEKKKTEENLGYFQATKEDASVNALVTRWAEESGKTLYWDSDNDSIISNHKKFNALLAKAGVNEHTSLKEAINKAVKVASYNRSLEDKLKVCKTSQDDAVIVVRPITFPCD